MGKIQEIVDKVERYDTVDKFVTESLKNITIFWLEPEKAWMKSPEDLWNDLTPEMKKAWSGQERLIITYDVRSNDMEFILK